MEVAVNVLLIPPGRSLMEEIIPKLIRLERDYSTNLVVFPGKRPSHFLRKALAREIKASFVPPVVLSIDEFVDHLCEKIIRGRKLESIDAVTLLYNIHCKDLQPLGGRSFMTPDSFFPIGLKIYRDIEELYIEGVDYHLVREIQPYTEEVIPEQTLKRLQSLSFFYEEFYKTVKEMGFSTRSLRYRAAADSLDESGAAGFQQMIFAGFFALTRSEKKLFRKLVSRDDTLFIFQDGRGIKEKLSDLGITDEIIRNTPSPFGGVELIPLSTPERPTHPCTPPKRGHFPDSPSLRVGDKWEGEQTESKVHECRGAACRARTDKVEGKPNEPEIHFYSSADTHGQVYALHTLLGTKEEELKPFLDNTAIVLPSPDTLFPLLRQGISMIDEENYNISLGYPLQRTPVFAFLNNIMELITTMDGDRIYLPEYLNFILHPYTKNIYFNGSAESTRIMFHALEEALTNYRTRTFVTIKEIEEDERFIRLCMDRIPQDGNMAEKELIREHLRSIHRNTIEKFLSFRDMKDFSTKCTELLTYIFNNSTARLHPLFYPFSEAFVRSLEIISCSLMKDIVFSERSSYFTFFRKYLMTCYTPFEGTPLKGLQVLGFLETRNLVFERLFILDLNEEVLPDTRKEDTLLPFKAREILGLPTYRDRDDLAAYYFGTLLAGAKEAHLFFIENDKKERSRFVEKLLWDRQKRDRTTGTERYIQSLQYQIDLRTGLPSEIRKTDNVIGFLRELHYSASTLDLYLRCGLQFYYSSVLRLDRKEELSGDIEKADIGKFIHHVLSRYFLERKGRLLTPEDIDMPGLDLLINRNFDKQYGERPAGAVYLLKKQIKRHLRDFFEKYFSPLIRDEAVTIVACEEDIHIKKDFFHLKGRIDSIITKGGKTVVIDYKTGANPDYLKVNFDKLDISSRTTWNEAIGSIQLPFYMMLYSEQKGTAIKDLDAMFLLLGRSLINREIELPLFSGDNVEDKFKLLKQLIFFLLEEITDPGIPFTYANDRKKTCPDCGYRFICGTQWIVK
jgi:ATP-dependent helicase/nuclease subunit B